MPRRAHRRCKEQGPTCNGVAHPGFDICARCLHDVVRPRMREEKAMMRERQIQRQKLQLSKENRSLISEVDLNEPHIKTSQEVWEAAPEVPKPVSISRVIAEMRVDAELDEAYEQGKSPGQFLGEKLLEIALENVPVVIDGPRPSGFGQPEPNEPPNEASTETEEEQSEPVAEVIEKEIEAESTVAHRKRIPMELRQEIAAAYQDGMQVDEICRALDVGIGTIYSSLNKLKIPRRQHHPGEVVFMPDKSSPAVSSVVAEAPTPNGAVSGLPEWIVTYEVRRTETAIIAAKDFNAAAAAVAAEPGIEVVSVARKRA